MDYKNKSMFDENGKFILQLHNLNHLEKFKKKCIVRMIHSSFFHNINLIRHITTCAIKNLCV